MTMNGGGTLCHRQTCFLSWVGIHGRNLHVQADQSGSRDGSGSTPLAVGIRKNKPHIPHIDYISFEGCIQGFRDDGNRAFDVLREGSRPQRGHILRNTFALHVGYARDSSQVPCFVGFQLLCQICRGPGVRHHEHPLHVRIDCRSGGFIEEQGCGFARGYCTLRYSEGRSDMLRLVLNLFLSKVRANTIASLRFPRYPRGNCLDP